MTFDLISDLHIDYYKEVNHNNKKSINSFIEKHLIPKSDTLVIAGDISDSNEYSFALLLALKSFYKNIIVVFGNHDYFVPLNSTINSFERVNEIKEFCEGNNIHLLDGNTITIDNITFGGTMGWYDAQYLFQNYDISKDKIIDDWKDMSLDYKFINPKINIFEFFENEKTKIQKVYQNCDVMITHINPSIYEETFAYPFNYQYTNAFYSFDGSKFLKDTTAQYWLFGHTHANVQYTARENENVKCICNPLGISEFLIDEKEVLQIEINKIQEDKVF